MTEEMKLAPELAEKLKAAKTTEEIGKILIAETGTPEKKKLSLDELDAVAGGVPEYFIVDGCPITPEDIYYMTQTVRAAVGIDQAIEFLTLMLKDYYSPKALSDIVYAYKVYGPNMWGWLGSKGY